MAADHGKRLASGLLGGVIGLAAGVFWDSRFLAASVAGGALSRIDKVKRRALVRKESHRLRVIGKRLWPVDLNFASSKYHPGQAITRGVPRQEWLSSAGYPGSQHARRKKCSRAEYRVRRADSIARLNPTPQFRRAVSSAPRFTTAPSCCSRIAANGDGFRSEGDCPVKARCSCARRAYDSLACS